MLRAGRHVASRAYPGVGVREVLISVGAIMFAGGLVFGTVIAQRATPAEGGWVATTGSALPAVVTSINHTPISTTTVGVPAAAGQGPPGVAGPPGPPGPSGAPAPTVTVPSTTVAPPTTWRCRPPPSHPHPTTTQKPCLPH